MNDNLAEDFDYTALLSRYCEQLIQSRTLHTGRMIDTQKIRFIFFENI